MMMGHRTPAPYRSAAQALRRSDRSVRIEPVSAGTAACDTMCEIGRARVRNLVGRGLGMIENVKARFSNGVLTPPTGPDQALLKSGRTGVSTRFVDNRKCPEVE